MIFEVENLDMILSSIDFCLSILSTIIVFVVDCLRRE